MNPLLEGREVACYLGDFGAWVVLARHAAAGEAAKSAADAGAQAITAATPDLADLIAGQDRGAGNGPARRSPDRHHRWPARLGRRLTRPPSRYQARTTRPIARVTARTQVQAGRRRHDDVPGGQPARRRLRYLGAEC